MEKAKFISLRERVESVLDEYEDFSIEYVGDDNGEGYFHVDYPMYWDRYPNNSIHSLFVTFANKIKRIFLDSEWQGILYVADTPIPINITLNTF